jgi:hypothetical protein
LNDPGDNNWLRHLDPILLDYNNRCTKGTKIKRADVNKFNELKVLAQKYGVQDFTHIINGAVVGNFSPQMRKAIGFRFDKGSKVLVSRSSNYNLKSDAFAKRSADGSYGKKVYEVEAAYLRTTSNKQFYTMVYKLKNMEALFYPTELIPALFSEAETAGDEDAADRRKKALKRKRKRERE